MLRQILRQNKQVEYVNLGTRTFLVAFYYYLFYYIAEKNPQKNPKTVQW